MTREEKDFYIEEVQKVIGLLENIRVDKLPDYERKIVWRSLNNLEKIQGYLGKEDFLGKGDRD